MTLGTVSTRCDAEEASGYSTIRKPGHQMRFWLGERHNLVEIHAVCIAVESSYRYSIIIHCHNFRDFLISIYSFSISVIHLNKIIVQVLIQRISPGSRDVMRRSMASCLLGHRITGIDPVRIDIDCARKIYELDETSGLFGERIHTVDASLEMLRTYPAW